jgi:hypothetical protein
MPAKAKKYTLGTSEQLFDLTCPSGQTCQVRRPGPQGLIEAGILDSLDTLTGIIKTEHLDRVDGKITTDDVKAFVGKPNAIRDGLELMSKVVLYVVVQPELHPTPEPGKPRVAGLAYVDQVDLEDQAYILQYAMGGTKSLETFRTERAELLGDLQGGAGVPVSAQ